MPYIAGAVAFVWLVGASPKAGGPGEAGSQANAPSREAETSRLVAEAAAALRRQDFAAAIAGFEKLVRLAPGVAEFHANLAMAYYSVGRFREAARECREALKRKPALTNAHYFLGASLAEAGNCKDALPYLEADYPRINDPDLKRAIGMDAVRCAMALNRPPKALEVLQPLDRDFPDDPDVLYLSSHVFSELSTRASERLLEVAPGSYQAHQFNAEVLEIQGKLSEAADEYRKALSFNPRLPGIHYRLGRLLLAGPREAITLEAARREFEEELQIDPDSAPAEYELGEMARQARQWDQAIKHFKRAAQLDPAFAQALIGLGKSLVSAGRAQEAVAPLEAAVRLEPDNPNAHYQLSFAYRRVGREQEAQTELMAYRATHQKYMRTREKIRTGIVGREPEPQTTEPPE